MTDSFGKTINDNFNNSSHIWRYLDLHSGFNLFFIMLIFGTLCYSSKVVNKLMLKKLNKITLVYFPHRQLLIRQNGEVKYLPISTSIQLFLTLILLTIFTWFSYSTTKYFSLNEKVSQTKDILKQSQTNFDALSSQYQTKNTQLNQQLSQLQQQQFILQNLYLYNIIWDVLIPFLGSEWNLRPSGKIQIARM